MTTTDPTPQGTELRRRRRALNVTTAQLAAALGCSRVTLSHTEAGLRNPPRQWWSRADGLLGAGGNLLRLFDGITPGPDPVWPSWDEGPVPAPTVPEMHFPPIKPERETDTNERDWPGLGRRAASARRR